MDGGTATLYLMERRESSRGRDIPQADVYDFRQVFPFFSAVVRS